MLYADVEGVVSKSAEGLTKMMSHCERLRSSGYHGVGEEDGNHAAAATEPDTPYLAARHGNSRSEVETDSSVFVPGRLCQRNCQHYARYQTTGPTRVGMLRSVQTGTVQYGDRFVHAVGCAC